MARHPWLVFVLPFVVYMLGNSFEPTPPSGAGEEKAWFDLGIEYRSYPLIYTLKIACTLVAIGFVWPGYKQFPWRLSPLAPLVGAVGVLVWIALTHLALEPTVLGAVGLDGLIDAGRRSAFNPLVELQHQPAWAWGFLALRFYGLVAIVPLIEEFFLRGFVMRFVAAADWWKVPFGTPHLLGIALATAAAVSMHPAEILAELCWFSLVTWLMIRTRNIWDCVVAHGVTNGLLGLYVVGSHLAGYDQWHLL
ncbi:MAG: CAAX prenyl protease-related protein [Pirellulales bacterium]|nr:CAAX prenyl protease-related protein [Pirellulales bacterium]